MSETAPDAVTADYHSTRPSEAVVLAVADAKNVDPLELEPLNNAIDPDALNELFQPIDDESSRNRQLGFSIDGCTVVVHGDGRIVVTPPGTKDKRSSSVPASEN